MTERLSYKDLGFWRSIGRIPTGSLFGAWDFWAAAALAIIGTTIYVNVESDATQHAAVTGDYLAIGGALFGVIIAGFAIVASLMGDRYARFLRASGSSSLHVLREFVVVAGLLVTAIVLAIIFRAASAKVAAVAPAIEQVFLGITSFFFFWSLFASLQLVKFILGLAVTNVELSLVDGETSAPLADEASKDRRSKLT